MAKRPTPKRPAKLYIAEWLAIRGMDQQDLAAAIRVEPATVSRYISGTRRPDMAGIRALEEALNLMPGQLSRPPDAATAGALLAGLSDQDKREALNYIEYLRRRGE